MGSSNEKIVTHIQIAKTCHYPHPLIKVILALKYNVSINIDSNIINIIMGMILFVPKYSMGARNGI